MQHLAGIHSQTVATNRIRSHCLFSGDENGTPVIFIHGNLSAATFFEELMLDMPTEYRCIATDLRGYGDSEDLRIDATRGMRDLSDDLESLMNSLQIASAHLLGWSAGAGVIMQFVLDHPKRVNSICLVAPVSPFGFGGTHDIHGTANTPDFAGSGAGTTNPDAIEQMRQKNASLSPVMAPRKLLRDYFVNSSECIVREDILVEAMLKQKLGEHRYPGDSAASPLPPHMAPGKWGPINALSPRYFNVSGLTDLRVKPPVLWVRGTADSIISDNSAFDLAALLHDPSDASSIPPQPMVSQMREMLRRYERNGGHAHEIVMQDVGHTPFMEQPEAFLQYLLEFLSTD